MNRDINLKHLDYFLTVARLGSINKAAQALFISQPYLGKIIKDLEDNMGVILFQRTRHGVTLTPDGLEFMEHAENIIKEVDNLQLMSASSRTEHSDPLIVSMTKFSHIMESFIEIILRHKNEPSFTHRLNEGSPEDVIEDVFSGQANVGVLHFDSKRHNEIKNLLLAKGLSYHFLAYVKPHIIISKNHPLIQKGLPVTLSNLADYGFARYLGQYEDFTYRIFSQDSQYNLSYGSKIVYLAGRATLMHLISKTDFYSIGIHDFSVQDSAYQATSIPIEDCDGMFEFGYIIPSHSCLSEITEEFIEDLKKRLG